MAMVSWTSCGVMGSQPYRSVDRQELARGEVDMNSSPMINFIVVQRRTTTTSAFKLKWI